MNWHSLIHSIMLDHGNCSDLEEDKLLGKDESEDTGDQDGNASHVVPFDSATMIRDSDFRQVRIGFKTIPHCKACQIANISVVNVMLPLVLWRHASALNNI